MVYLKYLTFLLVLGAMILDGISCRYQILKTSMDQKRLYIFGDSVFDAGNQQYLLDEKGYIASIHYPYGFTYFTNATGRYCDGRTVSDFISEFANLGLIPPSMEPGADFNHGANFASAAAQVLDTNFGSERLNLGDQLNNFTGLVTRMKTEIGDAESKKILMEAVYLISIGGVDYLSFYENYYNNGTLPTLTEQEAFVETVVGNISARLLEIYSLGGRKFAFQNVGPMGCLPMMQSTFPTLDGQCVEILLELPKMHNSLLSKSLNEMTQNFRGFKYAIFDYYNNLLDRIRNPKAYGLVSGRIACCGYVDDKYRSDGCGRENSTLCPYPSAYLFFDGDHTAQHTNLHLALLIWNASNPITWPYNVRQLFEENLAKEDDQYII